MINVIGGKYRSRVLDTPSENTLPTKNMVRGALFSALGDIAGTRVLDLFAGSGALGIEALSRGAAFCDFVDAGKEQCRVVKGNLEKLKETNARVLNMDALDALKELKEEGRRYDVVLLDPPYAMKGIYQASLDFLFGQDMLEEGAKLMIEYEGELPLSLSEPLARRDYRYGKTKILYLRRERP